MTAEVGVMNRNGIALAADSAVTVGPARAKIYSSVDKLFQLAENAPVGIMVYGSASFLGVPWETIIKTYRERSGNRTLPRLADYAFDFLRFLETENRMFSPIHQKNFVEFVSREFFKMIRFILLKQILEKALQLKEPLSHREVDVVIGILAREQAPNLKNPFSVAQTRKLFTDLVHTQMVVTKKSEKLDGLPAGIVRTITRKYRAVIAAVQQEVFEKFPTSRLTRSRLIEIIPHFLTRKRLEEAGVYSGIVIAGFGEQEHYPSLVENWISGVVAGHALHAQVRQIRIGQKTAGCVVPFAQAEMVYTFMEGVDPNLDSRLRETTGQSLREVAEGIISDVKSRHPRYGKDLEGRVRQRLKVLLHKLYERWDQFRREGYSDPVMEMVASLPKDELGAMAESLVNLTKFKRRVSKEQETVGGPIDVAIITKGDGFVWVKRKHYFESELNPRYLARLRRSKAE